MIPDVIEDVEPLAETPLDDLIERASLVKILIVADGRIIASKVVKDAVGGGDK